MMLKARVNDTDQLVTVDNYLKKYGPNSKNSSADLFCPLCNQSVLGLGEQWNSKPT